MAAIKYYNTTSGLWEPITSAAGDTNNVNAIYVAQKNLTGSGLGTITGAVNGSNTAFTVPGGLYGVDTLQVFLNGVLQPLGDAITQTTPASGIFTFTTAPETGDQIMVYYQLNEVGGDIIIDPASGAWGEITGDIADQADLQTALDARVSTAGDTLTGALISNSDYKTSAGVGFTPVGDPDASTVMYMDGGTDFLNVRNYTTWRTIINVVAPPDSTGTLNNDDREATLSLNRGEGGNAEFMDLYNNGYAVERQMGIRIQKRGTGEYRDFVLDYSDNDGETQTEVIRANNTKFEIHQDTKVDQIDELTTDAGVTVESVLIKDGLVDGVDVSALPTPSSTTTFTSKTIALGSNTVSGTIAQFNTAVTDADLATLAGTETLTNKAIQPRVGTITSASSITPTASSYDMYKVTALAANLTINSPGTGYHGQKLILSIYGTGTTRTLTWNAIYYPVGVTLPTSYTPSKQLYVGMIYNSDQGAGRWDVIAVSQET